jgi:hypothetical protein
MTEGAPAASVPLVEREHLTQSLWPGPEVSAPSHHPHLLKRVQLKLKMRSEWAASLKDRQHGKFQPSRQGLCGARAEAPMSSKSAAGSTPGPSSSQAPVLPRTSWALGDRCD